MTLLSHENLELDGKIVGFLLIVIKVLFRMFTMETIESQIASWKIINEEIVNLPQIFLIA